MEPSMNPDGGYQKVPANLCSVRMITAQKRLLYYTNLYGVPMDVDFCGVPMDVDPDVPVNVVSCLSNLMSKLELYEPMDVGQ